MYYVRTLLFFMKKEHAPYTGNVLFSYFVFSLSRGLFCCEQILVYVADRTVVVDLVPAVGVAYCCYIGAGSDRIDNLSVLALSLIHI